MSSHNKRDNLKLPRLSVQCLGADTLVSKSLGSGTATPSAVCMVEDSPILLFGAGPGVLQQCLKLYGQVPAHLVLPSAKMHYIAELQSIIQFEAAHARKLSIYAATDVISAVVDYLDDDLVSDLRDHVEFLQLGVATPTAFYPDFFLMAQLCDGLSGVRGLRHNFCVMDAYQRPLCSWIDGPLSYRTIFHLSPAIICRVYHGLDVLELSTMFDPRSTLLLVGQTAELDMNELNRLSHTHKHKLMPDARIRLLHTDDLFDCPQAFAMDKQMSHQGYEDLSEQVSITRGGSPTITAVSMPQLEWNMTGPEPIKQEVRTAVMAPTITIKVFNNEDKGADATVIRVVSNESLMTLRHKISDKLNLKPIGNLHAIEKGSSGLVRQVSELYNGQQLVVTKQGGATFDIGSLPYGMSVFGS